MARKSVFSPSSCLHSQEQASYLASTLFNCKSSPMSHKLNLDGTLHPHRHSALSSEVSGVLISRRVQIGTRRTGGYAPADRSGAIYAAANATARRIKRGTKPCDTETEQTWQRVNRLHKNDTATEEELQRAKFDRDSANAQKKAANTALKMAQLDLGKTVLCAPFAGEVAAIHGEIGQTIAAGHPLVNIASTDTLIVRTSVSADKFNRWKKGSRDS